MEKIDYQRVLDCLSAADCTRSMWIQVGMALKHEGCDFSMWDRWSAADPRPGQYPGSEYCWKRWNEFGGGSGQPVTGATIVQYARDYGRDPFEKRAAENEFFDWDDDIYSDGIILDDDDLKKMQVPFRASKRESFQIIDYLEACFKPDEHPNIITNSMTDERGKIVPHGCGIVTMNAERYISDIRKRADRDEWFDETFGSYDHAGGVWIRVNPVVGSLEEGQYGIADRHITSYNNALIECDTISLEDQMRLIKELKIPYKALVYSGGKSIHAIVRVDALSIADYKERVRWLFDWCKAHGLPVDTQNCNPSRLTRLPGCDRGERKQFLIETNPDPMSFDEFRAMAKVEEDAAKLEVVSFAESCKNPLPLADPLIDGVLRKGHKMLISGPSKAGKSFALIALMIAVAEGKDWMGYPCETGQVMYLNLEIDRPSFEKRVRDVYQAKEWPMEHPDHIDIINLRGMGEPLDTLTPKLEARLKQKKYDLVIIDPIYKVITGDENSAGDMGKFCNLFDRIAKAGGCAVAYCHHHSKGGQAHKSAIDRASGSGVFARDPDAIVDMTEIGFTDLAREETKARMIEHVTDQWLQRSGQREKLEKVHPDWLSDRIRKQELVRDGLDHMGQSERLEEYQKEMDQAESLGGKPAYRISMTLREFASPDDRNVFFDYPVHIPDPTGYLGGMFLQGDSSIEAAREAKKDKTAKRNDEKRTWIDKQTLPVSVADMAEKFDVHPKTIRRWVKEQEDLACDDGNIYRKES